MVIVYLFFNLPLFLLKKQGTIQIPILDLFYFLRFILSKIFRLAILASGQKMKDGLEEIFLPASRGVFLPTAAGGGHDFSGIFDKMISSGII